ncbi:MAG TPA: type II secretion system F family protein [Gemmataceae bacterium]|nr:type II secretion system F family protein [Gemmataceae bacterium]
MGLALLIFLSVTLGLTAGLHLLSDLLFPEATRVRRRVAQEFGTDKDHAAISPLFKNLDELSLSLAKDEPEETTGSTTPDRRSSWKIALEQADIKLSVRHLCIIALCLGSVLGAAGVWLAGPTVGVPLAAGGLALPFMMVSWKRRLRRDKFMNQLPGAFDLMSRIIRAGQSIPESLRAVADAFPDPIATEFSRCQNQLNLGLSPEVSFREMAQRSGILEMQIFVMALLIQRQAGGSLSEVLTRLAGLIRARLRLRKQIRTLTAEGRLQGWTLAVLPFVVFAALMVINRQYAITLLDHSRLLAATVAAIICGMLWIRKIVNVEV